VENLHRGRLHNRIEEFGAARDVPPVHALDHSLTHEPFVTFVTPSGAVPGTHEQQDNESILIPYHRIIGLRVY
jgi:hypothetical protein